LDAIKKIYQNNQDASFEYLYNALGKENNTIRESIAFLLGEIGKEEFIEPLCNLLDIRNLDVKKNTVIALGKIGSVRSLKNLIKIIEDNNTYWLIKKVTIDAIYNIFQNNWYRTKDDKQEITRTINKNIAFLTNFLRTKESENYKVKLSIIKLLENFGGDIALSALTKRVNDFHRVVRIYASNAIKKIEERLELENS
jgi:HEAT repeat protein